MGWTNHISSTLYMHGGTILWRTIVIVQLYSRLTRISLTIRYLLEEWMLMYHVQVFHYPVKFLTDWPVSDGMGLEVKGATTVGSRPEASEHWIPTLLTCTEVSEHCTPTQHTSGLICTWTPVYWISYGYHNSHALLLYSSYYTIILYLYTSNDHHYLSVPTNFVLHLVWTLAFFFSGVTWTSASVCVISWSWVCASSRCIV